MSYHATTRSHSLPQQPPAQRLMDDPMAQKTAQSMVMCSYQAHMAGFLRNVTVLWIKNLMNHTLNISVDGVQSDRANSCKIDLKPWHFWSKKGYKMFEVDGNEVEAYWDLRSAKFSGSPEPCKDFYVALVSDEEVVLLLGDYNKKAFKRTKSRPALIDAVLLCKKEHVFGKKSFSTSAKFSQREEGHDIVVESSGSGQKEPEMWISIDGLVVLHIKNLQWKFRGNQTVLVNKQPVQVLWDVHAWLFAAPGMDHGVFIFKPGPLVDEEIEEKEENFRSDGSECSGNSGYYSTLSYSTKASQFCLVLFAWKME